MKRTPSSPPKAAITDTWSRSTTIWGSVRCQMKRAGRVKITPAATDSPADPMVCTMLVSRIVPRRNARKIATAMTAAGIDALAVSPTRSPRYAFAAPKTTASRSPITTALTVSSAIEAPADT